MITKKTINAILNKLHRLPLPGRKVRICCLGCGKNILVPMEHEHHNIIQMQAHALEHEPALSAHVRAAVVRHDVPTNDLVITITDGRPPKFAIMDMLPSLSA